MSNLDQFTAALDACGADYTRSPGGNGTTVTVPDSTQTGGSGYALWHFKLDGSFDFVTHHAG